MTAFNEQRRTDASPPPQVCFIIQCSRDLSPLARTLEGIARWSEANTAVTYELVLMTRDGEVARALQGNELGEHVTILTLPGGERTLDAEELDCCRGRVVVQLSAGETPAERLFVDGAVSPPKLANEPLTPAEIAGVAPVMHDHGIDLRGTVRLHPKTVIEGPNLLLDGIDNRRPAHVGAFSYSSSCISQGVVQVGRYCSIAMDVIFAAHEHPVDWLSTSTFTYTTTSCGVLISLGRARRFNVLTTTTGTHGEILVSATTCGSVSEHTSRAA